jgi:hypothetical protein
MAGLLCACTPQAHGQLVVVNQGSAAVRARVVDPSVGPGHPHAAPFEIQPHRDAFRYLPARAHGLMGCYAEAELPPTLQGVEVTDVATGRTAFIPRGAFRTNGPLTYEVPVDATVFGGASPAPGPSR